MAEFWNKGFSARLKFHYVHLCKINLLSSGSLKISNLHFRMLLYNYYIGSCCGPYKRSYGAGYGSISRQCGTFMYSEIVSMDPPVQVYYDKVTQTAIGFMKYKSSDGLVSKGTWFTFNNKNSIEALTNFIGNLK